VEEIDELGKVSQILEALDADGRHKLLSLAKKQHVPAGTVVFREGDAGDEFFVIAKGSIRISVDDLGKDKEVALLEHGSFFGEMAMTGSHRRTATAAAASEAELVSFHGPSVHSLLRQYPAALETLTRVGLLRAEETLQKLSE